MASGRLVRFTVPGCGQGGDCMVEGRFWSHFDRAREDLWGEAVAGTLNRIACSRCGRRCDPPEPFLYTDIARSLRLMVAPDALARPSDVKLSAFPEKLLAAEHDVSLDLLDEIRALLEARQETEAGRNALTLSAVDRGALRFVAADGTEIGLSAEQVSRLAGKRVKRRESLWERRALRRRRFEVPPEVRQAWLDRLAAAPDSPDMRLVRDAIARRWFHPEDSFAMARLARRYQVEDEMAFEMFEAVTGIVLSDKLKEKQQRRRLPLLAALWYAYAQLPAAAQGYRGLGLEEMVFSEDPVFPAAFAPGKSPEASDRILLGFGAIKSWSFAHMLRHELGHALHDSRKEEIDGWLKAEFGWSVHSLPFSATREPEQLKLAVDGWIAELGGWEVAVPEARTEEERHRHRMMIRYACSAGGPKGAFFMTRFRDDLGDLPDWFGTSIPRQVYLQTGPDWWKGSDDWVVVRVPGEPDRLAFMCYQYRELVTVNARILELFRSQALPDRYALMSQKEFFAEFYATWNRRRGGKVKYRDTLRAAVPSFDGLLQSLAHEAA